MLGILLTALPLFSVIVVELIDDDDDDEEGLDDMPMDPGMPMMPGDGDGDGTGDTPGDDGDGMPGDGPADPGDGDPPPPATATPTDENDRVVGTADADVFDLLGGDDVFDEAAADAPTPPNADDEVRGGQGDDLLRSVSGADQLMGNRGQDTLEAFDRDLAADVDVLMGGMGDDTLLSEAGADRLTGGDGEDAFTILYAASTGADGDPVDGTAAVVTDFVPGTDMLRIETAVGEIGPETVLVLREEDGSDDDDGGTLVTDAAGEPIVLLQNVDEAGARTALAAYTVVTDGNDSIAAPATGLEVDLRGGDDMFADGAGDDVARGGDGDDVLSSTAGLDRLEGGDGDDKLQALDGATADIDVLDGGAGADELVSESGADLLTGGDGIDEFGIVADGRGVAIVTDLDAAQETVLIQVDADAAGNLGLARIGTDTLVTVDGVDAALLRGVDPIDARAAVSVVRGGINVIIVRDDGDGVGDDSDDGTGDDADAPIVADGDDDGTDGGAPIVEIEDPVGPVAPIDADDRVLDGLPGTGGAPIEPVADIPVVAAG